MPGPFPGMDPFLETTIRWRGFHGALISEICYALNRLLPQGSRLRYVGCPAAPYLDSNASGVCDGR